jgi:WD40 repeat protein
VATGGTDGTVHVWEIGSATELFSVPVEREVLALAFSPDGRRIAASTGYRYTFHQTARTDPRVYLIDVEAGKRIGELPYRAHVVDLAFGRDGRRLLTASWDRSARVWDVEGLNQVGSISHDVGVTAVAFSPTGGCIATATSDGAAMIWNADTREKLARIPDPIGATDSHTRTAVTFNHDGTLVATAMGSSGYVWTWRPEDLVAEACRKLSRDLTVEEWPHYLGDEPYRRTRELEPIAQRAE